MDYAHSRRAEASFEEVTAAVERAFGAYGFEVVEVHDVHRTLEAKGFHIHPVRIYELSSAGVEGPDRAGVERRGSAKDPMLLKVNVFFEDGRIVVAAIKPSVMAELCASGDARRVLADVERHVVAMIDEAVDATPAG